MIKGRKKHMRNIIWKYGNIIKKMELELDICQRFGNE